MIRWSWRGRLSVAFLLILLVVEFGCATGKTSPEAAVVPPLPRSVMPHLLEGPSSDGVRLVSERSPTFHQRSQPETANLAPRQPAVPASKPRTTLVVDIDETLSITDYKGLYWGIGSDDSRPLARAPETMRTLGRDFNIVYLTARPDSLAEKTSRWLSRNRFPLGRLLTAPSLFSNQSNHKDRSLAWLRRASPHTLIGIGDKASDAANYRAHGMLAIVVNPWSTQRYSRQDLVMRDWGEVGEFFTTHSSLLRDPVKLAAAMRAGDLLQRLRLAFYN